MGAGNVEFHHISVMLEETVKGLVTNKEGIYVDCTLGGAGHSHRIAELLSSKGSIIGIDQVFHTSDNQQQDMVQIREFYRPWRGKNRGTV